MPHVTKHAMMRYLTRVKRYTNEQASMAIKRSPDKVEAEMLPGSYRKRMEKFGDGKYPVGDYKLVVYRGAVVTTLYGIEEDFVQQFQVRGAKYRTGASRGRQNRSKRGWDA
jgi:hypothetical protein